jgi:hypothetical protein
MVLKNRSRIAEPFRTDSLSHWRYLANVGAGQLLQEKARRADQARTVRATLAVKRKRARTDKLRLSVHLGKQKQHA